MNEWDFKLRYLVVGSIYSWKNNEIVILFVGQILQVWDNVEKKTRWEKKKEKIEKKKREVNFNAMKWK